SSNYTAKLRNPKVKASRCRARVKGRAKVKVKAPEAVVVAGNLPGHQSRPHVGRTGIREWALFRKKKEFGELAAAVCRMPRRRTNLGRKLFTTIGEITNSSRTPAANLPVARVSL